MNHHVGSWLQIDRRKEDVSTAAHVIHPTGRTGNASVGLPGRGEYRNISLEASEGKYQLNWKL
jgi:hypothetical protein